MIELINGDCMDYMRGLPDNAFELCIADPPYGIGAGKEKPHNGWKDYGIKEWDNTSPSREYFEEIFRVSKNQIIWGANHFISKIPYDFSCFIIWDKGQRDFSLADGEMAWTSFKTAARFFNYSRGKALQEGKIHPTQKPIKLYEWLLINYAQKGNKIFDPFLGSGSSAIASDILGFDFVGIELDKDYFEAAKLRLENHQRQLKIF